jgi:RNA polymerase sigma factor (sigma-70 family)
MGEPGSESVFPRGRSDFTRTRQDLELWRAGDRDAFGRLWERYEPALRLIVARRIAAVRNSAARARLSADDLVQDTAITALRKLRDFEYRGPGALLAWMETTIGRLIQDRVDFWESDKRDPALEANASDTNGDIGGGGATVRDRTAGPATSAVAAEEASRVASLVNDLADRPRRILMLRYYLGADWDEIAREVGSPSAEAVRKEHARLMPELLAHFRRA